MMATGFNVFEMGAPGGTATPYWVDLDLDLLTGGFIGGVILFVTVCVGIVPSWHMSRTDANDVLKDGGRGRGGTTSARRMTGALLVGQMALTLILLVGAGLLARTYFRLYFTDLVIDTRGVVTLRIMLPVPTYEQRTRQEQFVATLEQRLNSLPAFSSAALGSDIPLHPLGAGSRTLVIEGEEPAAGNDRPATSFVAIGPRYFETLGVQVIRGRPLSDRDRLPGQEGVVVNQRFAARFFPDGQAIGKRIRLGSATAPWLTIVGVSPSLPNFFPDRGQEPVAYAPMFVDPGPQRAISVMVKTLDSPIGKAAAAQALREEVAAIDADIPVFGIQTMDEAAKLARYPTQFQGTVFSIFAAVALVLATVGLYALTAHGLAQRSHEIGVRMAMGANAAQVTWVFVRRTVLQVVIGLALGIAGALALGRLLTTFLRDVDPRDPITLVIVSMMLAVVALIAGILPARRASRVDPLVALRTD
jgi:putative ABC transport system permease protein